MGERWKRKKRNAPKAAADEPPPRALWKRDFYMLAWLGWALGSGCKTLIYHQVRVEVALMLIITNTVVMAWAALILIRHWWELTGRKLEQGLPVCLILGSLSYIYLNLAKLING